MVTVQLLAPEAVQFAAHRLTHSTREGISPATAAPLVREFCTCPACDADLDPDVTDARHEDRDVVWADRPGRKSAPLTCGSCGTDIHVLAEEKALGVVGPDFLPDELPDEPDSEPTDADLYYIPTNDAQSEFLRVNTFQLMLSSISKPQTSSPPTP